MPDAMKRILDWWNEQWYTPWRTFMFIQIPAGLMLSAVYAAIIIAVFDG